MKVILNWAALFTIAASLPSPAADILLPRSLVANGSFEQGIDPGSSVNLDAVDASTIAGWTLESGSIDYIGTRWEAGDGQRSLDLTGVSPGTVVQDVHGFKIGRQYRLSFLMAANTEDGGTVKSLLASVGGAAEVFTFDGTGFDGEHMGWSLRTLDFVATATTLKLSFSSLDDGLYGPALDHVRIQRVVATSANGRGGNPGSDE